MSQATIVYILNLTELILRDVQLVKCVDYILQWLCGHLRRRKVQFCKHLYIKCWRHYLKGINIESFLPYRESRPINVDNWRDIDV